MGKSHPLAIYAEHRSGAVALIPKSTVKRIEANAQLIAAAPEMLAALQAVLAEIDGPDRPHSADSWLPSHLAHQVRVAVANATRLGSWSNA